MVKAKFSSLDVRAMVNSIRPSVVGCKLTNIYDINSKVYLLKLSRRGFKCFLLLESGMRFHLTDYAREKSAIPSNYTMKLRKHIRMRRLTSIEQLGCDRCIDLTFGQGENSFHLILELYVSGNLILTDHEYRILTLLRSHNSEQSKVTLREIYPTETATGLLTVPIAEFPAAIDDLLNAAADRQENQEIKEIENDDDRAKLASKKESAYAKRSKKRVNHSAMPLVMLLHKLAPFTDPALCAMCIAKALKAADVPCENAFKLTVDDFSFEETVEHVQRSAELVLETLQSVSRPCDLGGGSMPVLAAPNENDDDGVDDVDDADDNDGEQQDAETVASVSTDAPVVPGFIVRKHVHVPPTEPYWANEEFTPLVPAAATDPDAVISFNTFHECVDEFYTKVEEHRAAESKAQHAKTVYDRVERIRVDQDRRVGVLQAEQQTRERQASLIEANVELVERALAMVNTMIASQIDWGELRREVKRQQRLGHPIAQHIHSLDFERNELQFLLSGLDENEDDEDEDRPMEVVPLDLNLTPHANVARLHTKRKETRDKTAKTLVGAENAIKQAEKNAQHDLQKFELKQTIRRVRQNWWFEKFFWFISSENYLVIAGHDSQQTEQIFARHLGPNDAFVQADVAGARSCFVRNPSDGPVPPATLREAGTMALCHSTAWDKRMVISAWWVPVAQVSRGGAHPDGEYMVVDGFFVQGRRTFMPPLYLEMGFTLLFHVGENSVSRHRGERRSRYLEAMADKDQDEDASAQVDDDGDDPEEAKAVEEECPAEDNKSCSEDEEPKLDQADAADENDATAAVSDRGDEPQEGVAEAVGELEDDVHAPGDEEQAQSSRGTRERLSKAERRKLKKGESGEAEALPDDSFEPPARAAKQGEKPREAKPEQPALRRGQKAKAKKIKDKYGDQDEEERQLRYALLGIRESKREPAAAAAAEAAAPGAAADASGDGAAPAAPEASQGKGAASKKGGGGGAAAAANGAGAAANGAKAGGAPRGGGEKAVVSSVRLTAGCDAEEGAPNLAQLAQLDYLTGEPQAEDEVLYALPMVAPYCSMAGHYTYRAKLTPGTQKKGQAVKQCLQIFEKQIERQPWKLLVNAIPENEAACLMMGSCKVSMPGMQKLQKQVQKEKKKDGKSREAGGKK